MVVDGKGKIFENRRKQDERRKITDKVSKERRKTKRRTDDKKA